MKIKVLFFGRLAMITGKTDLEMKNIPDTDMLSSELEKTYPAFAGLKYIVAVDKTVISGKRELKENMTVALLPPFSGG